MSAARAYRSGLHQGVLATVTSGTPASLSLLDEHPTKTGQHR